MSNAKPDLSQKSIDLQSSVFKSNEISDLKNLSLTIDGFNQSNLLECLAKLNTNNDNVKRFIFVSPFIVNSSRKMKSFDFIIKIVKSLPIIDLITIDSARQGTFDNINYSALRNISIAICINIKDTKDKKLNNNAAKSIEKWENSESGSVMRKQTLQKFRFGSSKVAAAVVEMLQSNELI